MICFEYVYLINMPKDAHLDVQFTVVTRAQNHDRP